MSHRKRKYRQHSDTYNSQYDQSEGPSPARPDPTLFIVAHEADVIRGPQAARTADSLEVFTNVDGKGGSRIGDGLLKWEGNGDMWVDRYARLSYPSNDEHPVPVSVPCYRSSRMNIWVSYPRFPRRMLSHCDPCRMTPKDRRRLCHYCTNPWYFSSASLSINTGTSRSRKECSIQI